MAERLTIIEFVEKYVAKFSQRPFLWEKNLDTNEWEPTTYEQTLAKAKRIAAGLMALGVQKGEKISYLSEGRDMWVIGELGVLYAGAVNVPHRRQNAPHTKGVSVNCGKQCDNLDVWYNRQHELSAFKRCRRDAYRCNPFGCACDLCFIHKSDKKSILRRRP